MSGHCKEPCPTDVCLEMTKAGMCGYPGPQPKKRVDLSKWTKVDGLIAQVWLAPDGAIVVTGLPRTDDTSHNCDAMGCGMDHVLWRGRREVSP